jgi:moderate conductance mechanosensitive channel
MEGGYLYELFSRMGLDDSGARLADVVLGRPFAIVLVFFGAGVVARIGSRLARRGVDTLRRRSPRAASNRADVRASTISSVLSTLIRAVVWSVAVILVLDIVGLNIAPLIAAAGIAGVAIGLGAQTLVRDFLAGFFILSEDQYGVGDLVTVGSAPTGTVEEVTMRITRLRDDNGVVWFIPNGEIKQLGRHHGPVEGASAE